MILQALIALVLLAQAAPAPAPAQTTAPAAASATPATPATPPVDPVIAEIDRLMVSWKGKSIGQIQGRLGLTETTKTASDGNVAFWLVRSETMGCGLDATGAMRCTSLSEGECRLGVAVDKEGKIKNWRAFGGSEACKKFVKALSNP